MEKSWTHRWFGWGKVPKKVRPELEREGVVFLDEGLRGALILRKFRAPGRWHYYKKSLFSGSLVITKKRVLAFAHTRPLVNITLDHERLNDLKFNLDEGERLVVTFDAGLFNDDWSGQVECRFATSKARLFLRKLGRNPFRATNRG